MRIANVKVNDKKNLITADVYVSKEERAIIRKYYKRKRCTGKLVERAVREGLENYIEKEAKRLAKKK